MNIKEIIKMYENGSVFVSGLRGTGKDMLTANVVVRRNKPYISNVDYGGDYIPIDFDKLDCQNTYVNFLTNDINRYICPYEDGTDVYVSDAGVYFPCQFNEQLNKKYGNLATSIALSRHTQNASYHFNAQSLGRVWDKFREQSEQYIRCNKCRVFFKRFVVQTITIYEKYDSCLNNVPPFPLKKPLINRARIDAYVMAKNNYLIQYGNVKRVKLIYKNKSTYNTRIFKEMLENGK